MAKQTLLYVVQSMLDSIGGDQVNSIDDTEESTQIARLARDLYYEMANTHEWPHLKKLVNLDATSTATPSHLKLPEDVQRLVTFKYDTRASVSAKKNFSDIDYLTPEDFLTLTMGRDSTATEVDTVTDIDGTVLLIYNDRAPTYWTSFDDEYIVCDAYDSDLESSLQSSKTSAWVWEEPTFTLTDGAYIDMPAKEYPLFIAELKALVWNDVATTPNAKAEQAARRARMWSNINKFRTKGGIRFPTNYGR
jgi:hypothetical protein